MGTYTETTSVSLTDLNVNIYFESGANLTVTLSSGYWLNNTGSTTININGTSRSSNYISSNYGVFNNNGVVSSKSQLNISNILIKTSGSTFDDVISTRYCLLRIDNSTINNDTNHTGVCSIITLNESFIYAKGSTFGLKSSLMWSGSVSTSSVIINEINGVSSGSLSSPRMRFHQTSFSLNGTQGSFLFTNPVDPTCSILLGDVYMHALSGSRAVFYNGSGTYKDYYYVAGTVVSYVTSPTGAGPGWVPVRPAGATPLDQWGVVTAAPY